MFESIKQAAERIMGAANKTPVMTSGTLNRMAGARVFFKCENFQKVGAFKFRGACNAISRLSDEEKKRGILAYSSGNHAQAVALVCHMMDIPATIVMPENAPKLKRSATESYGARVVEYDPKEYEPAEVAKELKEKHGYTFIPPFDHPDIIAGQGTAAYELYRDYGPLDMLLVPCGGGGLLSGSAIAAKGVTPLTRVVGVEPEVANDATRSFYSGVLQTVKNPPTIADGTRTPSLGKYTFPLVLQYVDEMITVSETAIRQAVAFFFYRMKIVVEPSGALGLAALLSGAIFPPEKTGVIISGGNMDGHTLTEILSETDQ